MQGRSFDLVYQQYFTEHFARLKTALSPAYALGATDVFLNFGVWLRYGDEACGNSTESVCPDVKWVCDYLTGEHPFDIYWLATTPTAVNGQPVEEVPLGHPMNMQSVCNVTQHQVVDRAAVLLALEPKEHRRTLLWWSSDGPHFHADANHGFNQALLHRLRQARSRKRGLLPFT